MPTSCKQINITELQKCATSLRVFDRISLSGTLYTARDAAHQKLMHLLDQEQALPFELLGAVIYYAGPSSPPDGFAVGSCGPTSSGRMDTYTPRLLDLGVCATIGKGERSASVIDAIKRNQSLYFCAVGGAGALACQCITSSDIIAFPELGCEAVRRLTIRHFPVVVAVDTAGNSIFEQGRKRYLSAFPTSDADDT